VQQPSEHDAVVQSHVPCGPHARPLGHTAQAAPAVPHAESVCVAYGTHSPMLLQQPSGQRVASQAGTSLASGTRPPSPPRLVLGDVLVLPELLPPELVALFTAVASSLPGALASGNRSRSSSSPSTCAQPATVNTRLQAAAARNVRAPRVSRARSK